MGCQRNMIRHNVAHLWYKPIYAKYQRSWADARPRHAFLKASPAELSNTQNILASLILGQGCLSHPSKPILKARAMDYLPISPTEKEGGWERKD